MFNLKTSIAVAALALTGTAHAAGNNLVADGTFAGGAQIGQYQTYYAGNGAASVIDGAWTVTSGSVDLIGTYWDAPAGTYSVDMDGASAGTITQDLNLAAGHYVLTFMLAGNADGGAQVKDLTVSVGSTSVPLTFDTKGHGDTSMGFTPETVAFTVTDGSAPTTLTFASGDSAGSYNGAAIADVDVDVSAVPEPASLGLLLAGIGMVGVMSSRRRAR